MSQFKSCIIILKPTSFFMSFVAEQLPDFDRPEKDTDTDNTAYTLPACDTDEEMLDQLERLFPYMFRYEVTRLLGQKLAAQIKADFLDFLYCFKFEVYTQPEVMETLMEDCRQLVCVTPKLVSFTSNNGPIDMDGLLQTLDVSRTVNVATALVKNFDRLSDLKPLLQRYCKPMLQVDKMRKAAQTIQWPTLHSWQMFHRYFSIKVHTQLVHLH